MLSNDHLFVLRKILAGDEPEADTRDLCAELVAQGYIVATTGRRNPRLKVAKGCRDITKVNSCCDGLAWAIAQGFFDHLSYQDYRRLATSENLNEYIDLQVAQRSRQMPPVSGRFGAMPRF